MNIKNFCVKIIEATGTSDDINGAVIYQRKITVMEDDFLSLIKLL